MRPDVEADGLRDSLAELLIESARATGASGAHVNFTTAEDQAALERAGFLRRHDCRFLWRNAGYRDFDDFLARFRADKRKKARRERRRVAESGIEFRTLRGEEMDAALWRVVFGFSERTFLRHGNDHYLSVDFLRAGVAPAARHDHGEARANAMARRWRPRSSSAASTRCTAATGVPRAPRTRLHFEACYYQGIDYCIEHGLQTLRPRHAGRAQDRARLRADAARAPRTGWRIRDSPTPIGRYLRARARGHRRLHRRGRARTCPSTATEATPA